MDVNSFRHASRRVAADGRKGWKRGLLCADFVRTFRAQNRDTTYSLHRNKEAAKVAAEIKQQIQSFFDVMQNLEVSNAGLFNNPLRIWNMDETAVDNVLGKHEKVFSPSDSKGGGFRPLISTHGCSKHITAVAATSAAGHICPLFFVIEGKRMPSQCLAPVQGDLSSTPQGIICRFTQPNWFPLDKAVTKMSERGSMEGAILTSCINHIDSFVRSVLSQDVTHALVLDGHVSRKDPDRVKECSLCLCHAVVNAANSTHFLQLTDQTSNKKFKAAMQELRDEFLRQGNPDVTKTNFNLACAIYAYECIKSAEISRSSQVTGIYPFDHTFPDRFIRFQDVVSSRARIKKK